MDCEKFHIRAAMTIFGLLHNIAFFFFFLAKRNGKMRNCSEFKEQSKSKGQILFILWQRFSKKENRIKEVERRLL